MSGRMMIKTINQHGAGTWVLRAYQDDRGSPCSLKHLFQDPLGASHESHVRNNNNVDFSYSLYLSYGLYETCFH